MKRSLLLIIILSFSLATFGQGFIKRYTQIFNKIIPDGQGGYITAGTSFMFLNSKGDSVTSKLLPSALASPREIIKTSDNGYLLSASGVIGKLNSQGDLIWQKNIAGTNAIFEDNNGDYLTYSGPVTKYDSEGTVLWNKTYPFFSVWGIEANAAGYVMIGTKNDYVILANCDSNGDTIKTKKYYIKSPSIRSLNWNSAGFYMSQVTDQKVLRFFSTLDTTMSAMIPSSFGMDLVNYKIDHVFCSTPDGNIFTAGYDRFINMYNISMAKQWSVICPDNFLSMTPLADGSVIVACTTFVKPYNSTIVKIDKYGKIYANSIKGKVVIDANGNCTDEVGQIAGSNILLKVEPGPYHYIYTDKDGNYEIPIDVNVKYNVSPILYNQKFTNNCTSSYEVLATQKGVDITDKDFYLTQTECPRLRITYNIGSTVRCFKGVSKIRVNNFGNKIAENVEVKLDLPDVVVIKSSNVPYSKSTNTYMFNIGDINSNGYKEIELMDSISCKGKLGDEFYARAISATSSSCINTSWGSDTTVARISILGSIDPNDKTVFPAALNFEDYSKGKKELQYKINFQNSGTSEARTIKIIDTLSYRLDPESIHDIVTSHPASLQVINENYYILIWTFKDVNLPAESVSKTASQGFVSFSVNLLNGLPDECKVSNRAAIFFDYNEPVITNDASVIISSTKETEKYIESKVSGLLNQSFNNYSITLVPNPISEGAQISITPNVKVFDLTIYNSFGVIVKSIQMNDGEGYFNRENLNPGVYYYSATNGERMIGGGKIIVK